MAGILFLKYHMMIENDIRPLKVKIKSIQIIFFGLQIYERLAKTYQSSKHCCLLLDGQKRLW